jgi:galactose mutarotase-like enzyme
MTDEILVIRSHQSSAEISIVGGEIRRWRVDGKDLLWTPNLAFWGRTSPILFPIIGWPSGDGVLIDDRQRPLTVHGFAKTSRFRLRHRTDSTLQFELEPDISTLELHPFRFQLVVQYCLTANMLAIVFEVRNQGLELMPYAIGIHPGFCWPLPGGTEKKHRLEFERAECRRIPVITSEGHVSSNKREVPLDGRVLFLESGLFEQDVLCFINANSSSIIYTDERSRITISSDNFPHWGIWSKPGGEFVCIQSWTGYGDAPNFTGSIYDKPSMIHLRPGESSRHAVEWKFGIIQEKLKPSQLSKTWQLG